MNEENTSEYKLDPFQIFKITHAVLLHYTTDYNYQAYHGKTSYKKETFERRPDKYAFHKLVRVCEAHHFNYGYLEYYIAWLHLDNDWVTPKVIEDKIKDFDALWRTYSESRLNYFKGDITRIQSLDPKHLFELLQTGAIHTQTLLILDKIKAGLIETMNADLVGSYLWDKGYKKLLKFRPFYTTFEPVNEPYFRQHIPETLLCQED
jgi:hypothetical protein